MQLIYSIFLVCVGNSYHCLRAWECATTLCSPKGRKLNVSLGKGCPFGSRPSVDEEGENLELNTEVQQVSLLFSSESPSVLKVCCKMPSMDCSRDQEGANTIQSTLHTRASANPSFQSSWTAGSTSFLFNHLEIIFVKKKWERELCLYNTEMCSLTSQ